MVTIKFKENELLKHNHLGLVRMFEDCGKNCLVKILNKSLNSWTIKRVQSRALSKIK